MSNAKISLYILLAIATVTIVSLCVWYYQAKIYKMQNKSIHYDINLSQALSKVDLKVLNLADENSRKLFIAGLNVIKSLTDDDYDKIMTVYYEEARQYLYDQIVADRKNITDLLELEEANKVKPYLQYEIVKFVKRIVRQEALVTINERKNTEYKTIIDRILKNLPNHRRILTQVLPTYNGANITELIVSNIGRFYNSNIPYYLAKQGLKKSNVTNLSIEEPSTSLVSQQPIYKEDQKNASHNKSLECTSSLPIADNKLAENIVGRNNDTNSSTSDEKQSYKNKPHAPSSQTNLASIPAHETIDSVNNYPFKTLNAQVTTSGIDAEDLSTPEVTVAVNDAQNESNDFSTKSASYESQNNVNSTIETVSSSLVNNGNNQSFKPDISTDTVQNPLTNMSIIQETPITIKTNSDSNLDLENSENILDDMLPKSTASFDDKDKSQFDLEDNKLNQGVQIPINRQHEEDYISQQTEPLKKYDDALLNDQHSCSTSFYNKKNENKELKAEQLNSVISESLSGLTRKKIPQVVKKKCNHYSMVENAEKNSCDQPISSDPDLQNDVNNSSGVCNTPSDDLKHENVAKLPSKSQFQELSDKLIGLYLITRDLQKNIDVTCPFLNYQDNIYTTFTPEVHDGARSTFSRISKEGEETVDNYKGNINITEINNDNE